MATSSSSTSRSSTPTSVSSSSSSESSSHTEASHDASTSSTSGSFDAGVKKKPRKSAAEKPAVTGAASAAQPANQRPINRTSCPQPVRLLVQCSGLLLGAGGLVSMIYAGMKLTTPDDPGVDAARGQHIALMVSGVFELAIAFVACVSAADNEAPAQTPVNPA